MSNDSSEPSRQEPGGEVASGRRGCSSSQSSSSRAIILRLPDGLSNGLAAPEPSVAPSLGRLGVSIGARVRPPIAGTYTTTFNPFNEAVKRDGLGGNWTMRLEPSGAVVLSPPAGFVPDTSLSGITYSLAGDLFRANLFLNDCKSVGNYRWSLAVTGHLSFTSIDDQCLIRQTFLTEPHWLASK